MSKLSRPAMKWSSLLETARPNQRLPSTFSISPKLFSTEASKPSFGSSDDQFLQTPYSGPVYVKLGTITKNTMKSDIINLLEGCNLNLKNLKVEYNQSYLPLSMMIEFPSISVFDVAIKTINRKGRLYNVMKVDKSDWDINAPYDGKAILLHGIPRNALIEDVERFLSGCQYNSTSIQIFVRSSNQGPNRMALIRFASQAFAMHAYITKNRSFCLNNQITVQVLH